MSDQRSAFRFRVPRIRPSIQTPQPAASTSTSQTRARSRPIQPQPQPQPPPPLDPPVTPSPPPAPQAQPPAASPSVPPPPPPPVLPIQPLGTVPASAPEPPIQPSTVPAPATQDEPASMTPTPAQTAPPSPPSNTKAPGSLETESQPSSPSQKGIQSPSHMSSQSHVPAKPPSPSTRLQPTSQPTSTSPVSPSRLASKPVKEISSLPSSPIVTETTIKPKEALPVPDTTLSNSSKSQTETENTPDAKDSKSNEDTFMEQSSEQSDSEAHIKEQPRIEAQRTEANHHEKHEAAISKTSNIPHTPQTKSMISDKAPESKSPQIPKSINGPSKKENPPSVITFAGDNRGTSMRIGCGANKREKAIHIYRRYKVNPDEITDKTTDGEESSKGKKPENDLNAIDNQGGNAYINCNIQEINNSMVFNCSIAEKNRGVHLGSSFNPKKVKTPKMKNEKPVDTNKVKVSITPSQKLTYEPTIRRRCLRGIFTESSDSDPDDPEMPRRHGCRYTCGEKSNKDDKMEDR